MHLIRCFSRRVLRAIGLVSLIATGVMTMSFTASAAAAESNTPTLAEILQHVSATLQELVDLSVRVEINQPGANGSTNQATIQVQAKLPDVYRVTYLKPDAFTDMFYILDRKSRKVSTYFPVTETVVVQSLEKVLADKSLPIADPDQVLNLPSPEEFDLNLVGSETIDKVLHYVVTARAKVTVPGVEAGPLYRFWIDSQRWLISRVEAVNEADKLVLSVRFSQYKLNSGIKEQDVRAIPKGADVRVLS